MSNLVIRILQNFAIFQSKIIDIFSEMHYSENTKFLTNISILGGAIWITLVEQERCKH